MRFLFVLIAALLMVSAVHAQVSLTLTYNVDRQPVWGPTGYDHVEYYYLPDIETYYSVPEQRFYYSEGGRWVGRSRLPARYHDFDLYTAHKVVVNEREPFRHHDAYRAQYASFKDRHDQQPIRDSRDSKYFINKHHPQHNNWMKQQQHDNGKGKGRGNGNGQNGNNHRGNHGDRNN